MWFSFVANGDARSHTHDRLRELEAENASLSASVTSATRDALRRAEAENARLKAAGPGMIYVHFV